MAYIGVSPSNGVRRKHTYTATASQTSFSGAGAEGATLSYSDSNFVDVYQNGVKLADEDYTATSGTAIVLAQGASADDIVEIIAFDVFSVADTVSKADGGTFDGNVTMAGTLGVTGTLTANGGAVFNEGGADVDFRVESDTLTHALFVDGANGNVGIGGTPTANLHVYRATGDASLIIETGEDSGAREPTLYLISYATNANPAIRFGDRVGNNGFIEYENSDDSLRFGANASEAMKIDATGAVTKPLQPAFQVKLPGAQSNIAVNSAVTILFANEAFDQNADFDTSTYTFTAPITGKYQLNIMILVSNLDSASTYYQIQLITSNRSYYHTIDPDFGQDNVYHNQNINILADMDASDTAIVKILQPSGTSQTDLDATSTFSGYLAC